MPEGATAMRTAARAVSSCRLLDDALLGFCRSHGGLASRAE